MKGRKYERVLVSSLIVAFLITMYAIYGGSPLWLLDKDAATMSLIYPAFHVNIFHLGANCLSLWVVTRTDRHDKYRNLFLAYIISCFVYPLAGRPILGASNLIYAYIGLCTPSFSHPWWKQSQTIGFWIGTFILLLFPSVSGITHVASASIGIVLAVIRRLIDRYDR